MTRALICGICGKMGENLREAIEDDGDITTVGGVDVNARECGVPVFHGFDGVNVAADVILDFSSPAALKGELDYAVKTNIPVVLASTGYSARDLELIEKAAERIAVFRSANFSLGICVLKELARRAAEILGENYDVEIIEKHHNKKKDAPSGTALALADCVNEVFENKKPYLYGRSGETGARGSEIGIHAVRGGNIVGEHEVIFAGGDEVITLSHSAGSKKIFAAGAVKAAKWLVKKPAGLYGMDDLLRDI